MRRALTLGLATLACVPVLACNTGLPGTTLGTFKVTAQVDTNTCGLGAPNPWTFDVELSQDGSTLYWSWLDGSPLLSGPIASSAATLTEMTQANVDGTDAGLGPCTMDRNDTLHVTLGSGTSPTTFIASIGYAISAVAGANCSDQLAAAGGQYNAIPCTMTYSATATKD
ncbi:MAG TPA: hypothetical protein VHV30_05985 [Polyangiaceae bacterium]|jgi:hypothetical protein|nr:hypothetical protein [Polyangiaceae bacterium]